MSWICPMRICPTCHQAFALAARDAHLTIRRAAEHPFAAASRYSRWYTTLSPSFIDQLAAASVAEFGDCAECGSLDAAKAWFWSALSEAFRLEATSVRDVRHSASGSPIGIAYRADNHPKWHEPAAFNPTPRTATVR
jgi:hypothetical protein